MRSLGDMGFAIGTLVPMIVVLITSERHLRVAWRICLGIAVIPPIILLAFRSQLKEPEEYNRQKMSKYPYGLIIRFLLETTPDYPDYLVYLRFPQL